jgi:hypothetical protein
MFGMLLMFAIFGVAVYMIVAKIFPAMAFQYQGRGERQGRAEYGRIKRETPDAPDARLTEAEFVDRFVRNGPSPWKYVLMMFALVLLGIPMACVVGIAGFAQ